MLRDGSVAHFGANLCNSLVTIPMPTHGCLLRLVREGGLWTSLGEPLVLCSRDVQCYKHHQTDRAWPGESPKTLDVKQFVVVDGGIFSRFVCVDYGLRRRRVAESVIVLNNTIIRAKLVVGTRGGNLIIERLIIIMGSGGVGLVLLGVVGARCDRRRSGVRRYKPLYNTVIIFRETRKVSCKGHNGIQNSSSCASVLVRVQFGDGDGFC